jgi:hypothetical protein
MRGRSLLVVVSLTLFGALALGWKLRINRSSQAVPAVTAGAEHCALAEHPAIRPKPQATSKPAAAANSTKAGDEAAAVPVDTATRAQFIEETRDFFAHSGDLTAEERAREAQRIAEELTRLERAGGMSAGETFVLRAGLIRETVPGSEEQAAQLKALKERYENDARTRLAAANTRSDPAFESYKVRESEIVSEVMSMQTIPNGVSRDEYLRRRLQAAREQMTPP